MLPGFWRAHNCCAWKMTSLKTLYTNKDVPCVWASPRKQEHSAFHNLGSQWQDWALGFFDLFCL